MIPTITTLLCLLITSALHAADAPNIILIMSDDMGYSDIGCYGSEVETPTLDGLAANGLRFTQFYNTARCCPTRASLLTGLYPHQAGVGHMMSDRGHIGYRGDLNNECMTIAEVLKGAGYGTYISGKWHVTKHTAPDGPKHNWPLQRGFDRFYGTIHGAGSFYDPNSLTRDNTQISPYDDPEYKPETFYYTHAINHHAVQFINEHHKKSPEKPFFLYVSHTAAHWPMHALEKDIAKYKGRYDKGYAALRKERFERMRKIGLLQPQWELSPQAENWETVKHREWEIRCMEVYAAMIDSMDQGIGDIVQSLKENNQFDNTLILFFQDNGGCAENFGRNPTRKFKERPAQPLAAMSKSELQRNMVPDKTRDGWPVIYGPAVMPGPPDTYIGYGRGWANVSNTPFREYKHWVHEGGISTPLIAHWPKRITRKGQFEHQPGHLIDLMATCVDLSGAKYPTEYKGQKIQPMEGLSLAPAFQGEKLNRDAIYWEHEGNRAIRVGKWKLVAKGSRGAWELYDIDADRSELNNLAEKMPEKVTELKAKWQKWAERARVLPLNPQPNRTTNFSKKKRFQLKADANLPQNRSPDVRNKSIQITATVKLSGTDGVIVAQGGTAEGYAFYLKEGKLAFAVRRGGALQVVMSEEPIPQGTQELQAVLDTKRNVVLSANGKQVASGGVASLLTNMPIDGLQVGQDLGGLVSLYPEENDFPGTIKKVVIELGE